MSAAAMHSSSESIWHNTTLRCHNNLDCFRTAYEGFPWQAKRVRTIGIGKIEAGKGGMM